MFPARRLPSVIYIRGVSEGLIGPRCIRSNQLDMLCLRRPSLICSLLLTPKHRKHYGNNGLRLHRESYFCCVEKWLWSILSWVLMVASNLSLCFPHPWTEEMFTCGWQGSRRFEEASFNLLLVWSEMLPDSLTRGQTPGSLRPDADRLRRCLRGKKNLLLAKIEQKALHVLSDKTHVTPPLPCFHGHVVRDFPQAAPRLLGVSAANSERRTRFRRGASWETTVDEETDEGTEINFFFGRRCLGGLVASGGKESNSAQQVDMCGFRAASPLNYMSVRPPRRHSGNIFLLNWAWERPPWC